MEELANTTSDWGNNPRNEPPTLVSIRSANSLQSSIPAASQLPTPTLNGRASAYVRSCPRWEFSDPLLSINLSSPVVSPALAPDGERTIQTPGRFDWGQHEKLHGRRHYGTTTACPLSFASFSPMIPPNPSPKRLPHALRRRARTGFYKRESVPACLLR